MDGIKEQKHQRHIYCTSMEIIVLIVLLLSFATRPNSVHAHTNDLIGLENLQQEFSITGSDQDPCLWSWIHCDSTNNLIRFSRVIAINLSSSNLKGKLPDFGMMDALKIIDFHDNNLYGPIPDFLGTRFPNLTKLDLSNNDFSGLVPASVSNLTDSVNISLVGNPNLCISETCNTKRRSIMTNEKGSTSWIDDNEDQDFPDSDKMPKLPPPKYDGSSTTNGSTSDDVVYYYTVLPAFIVWCVVGVYFIYKHRQKVALAIQQGRLVGADQGVGAEGIATGLDVIGPKGERDHVPLNPV